MPSARSVAAAALILCFGILVLTAQPPQSATAYTQAQAATGRTAYLSTCGKCHTANLTGRKGDPTELPPVAELPPNMREVVEGYGGKVPPLIGAEFITKWRTTKDLSNRINEAVGGFRPEGAVKNTYLDLTAYILQANGARSGPTDLTAATDIEIRTLTTATGSK